MRWVNQLITGVLEGCSDFSKIPANTAGDTAHGGIYLKIYSPCNNNLLGDELIEAVHRAHSSPKRVHFRLCFESA